MRLVVSFIIFGLFFGCSYKPNILSLNSYTPKFHKISNKISIQKAYIKSIIDTRNHENIIGQVENPSEHYYIYSKTNIKLWFYQALEKGLKEKGYIIVNEPTKEAISIKVAIMKLNLHYDKSITKHNNLTGIIDIQLSTKNQYKHDIKNIVHEKSTWFSDTPSRESMENFLQEMMDDATSSIIAKSTSL